MKSYVWPLNIITSVISAWEILFWKSHSHQDSWLGTFCDDIWASRYVTMLFSLSLSIYFFIFGHTVFHDTYSTSAAV